MSFHASSQAGAPRQSLKTLPPASAHAVHLAPFLPWHQKPEQSSAIIQVEGALLHREKTQYYALVEGREGPLPSRN